MKIIKRTMTSEITQVNDEYSMSCQASLNSNGGITLRNYYPQDRNKDEILILSNNETQAIFELMYKIKMKCSAPDLPF